MNMKREKEIAKLVITKLEGLSKFAKEFGGDAHANFRGGWEQDISFEQEGELSNDELAIAWIKGTVPFVDEMIIDWELD